VVLGHEVAHALADHGNERMSKQEGKSSPPQFLSTHPALQTRIADIKKYLPEALPYYEKATQ
jgi:predicted Zn-dependent protease